MLSALEATPRYLLHERLGVGGMGVVYRGTLLTPAGARQVAIKRLRARADLNAHAAERLIAEAKLVFQLTHANICQVLDLGMNEEGTFIVMEYTQGLDLGALLARLAAHGGRLDVASAIHVAREVARALDFAHRRRDEQGRAHGIVHGDVTPHNILVSVEGEVKLADFGIALALGGGSREKLKGGTPGFSAPEAETLSVDHRADIYSLGVTLRVALGEWQTALPDPARARLRGEIAPELSAIIDRATAFDPKDRFLSAHDLERALSMQLARRYPDFTPTALGAVVRMHEPDPGHADRQEGKTIISLTGSAVMTRLGSSSPSASVATVVDGMACGREARGTIRITSVDPVSRGARRTLLVVAAIVLLGGGGAAVLAGSARRAASIAQRARPQGSVGSLQDGLPSPSAPHPSAASMVTAVQADVPAAAVADGAPAAPAPMRPAPSAPARRSRAFLTVTAIPWGAVYVDGRRVAEETPAYRLALPAGRHEVRVFYPSRGAFSPPKRVTLPALQDRVVGFGE